MKLPDLSSILAKKLPPQPDFRAEIICATTATTLKSLGALIVSESSLVSELSYSDPATAAERIRKLSLQVSNALVRAAAACDEEHARRKYADAPDIKLHTPDEPQDDCDSSPVGAGVRGVPVPQSDRTGA